MIDYYLKAPTEADLHEALEAAGFVHCEGYYSTLDNALLDVIGIIRTQPVREQTGTAPMETFPDAFIDENGERHPGTPVVIQIPIYTEVAPAITLPGYHANVRMLEGELPEALQPFAIDAPANPVRVWG